MDQRRAFVPRFIPFPDLDFFFPVCDNSSPSRPRWFPETTIAFLSVPFILRRVRLLKYAAASTISRLLASFLQDALPCDLIPHGTHIFIFQDGTPWPAASSFSASASGVPATRDRPPCKTLTCWLTPKKPMPSPTFFASFFQVPALAPLASRRFNPLFGV